MKVKIFGAGSIGNHFAHASRTLGWDVLICDTDADALTRTEKDIYPGRYGAWDDKIRLFSVAEAPEEDFDLVVLGTPPDTHLDLALKTLREESPRALLIEKPLCTPDLESAQVLHEVSSESRTSVLVGYNHTLALNCLEAEKILRSGEIGDCIAINAGFQEYWGGIFDAHPWLNGPHETYLGFSTKGGGASGEHSHAINIWQHFAHVMKMGRIVEVSAFMDFVDDGRSSYDRICNINVKTEEGLLGMISQDVITDPPKKQLRIQGASGFLEWHVNFDPQGDAVVWQREKDPVQTLGFPKKRPDDFIRELEHINEVMLGNVEDSPISLERGLDTMLVIAAAHLSHENKSTMRIDYSEGYSLNSIHAMEN